MSTNVNWRAVNFSSLRIEEWNEEFTVFQTESGKTHFLNQLSMCIISTLNGSPASVDEVCKLLIKQFKLSPKQNFGISISKTFHRFEALGLIERAE